MHSFTVILHMYRSVFAYTPTNVFASFDAKCERRNGKCYSGSIPVPCREIRPDFSVSPRVELFYWRWASACSWLTYFNSRLFIQRKSFSLGMERTRTIEIFAFTLFEAWFHSFIFWQLMTAATRRTILNPDNRSFRVLLDRKKVAGTPVIRPKDVYNQWFLLRLTPQIYVVGTQIWVTCSSYQ